MAATITVVCPSCSHKMRASTKHIGRKGRCPQCGNLVPITDAAGAALPTVSLRGDDREDAARPVAGTPVNQVLAGLIGLAATVALYGLVFFPLYKMNTYIGRLMCDRGAIQYEITLVTCWGLAILVLKYLAVRRER